MKNPILLIVLLIFYAQILLAQSFDKKVISEDLGTWDIKQSTTNKISISSHVTRQNNLDYINQKKITEIPKYKYELVLTSNSIYYGKLTKTWIYGAKVFIDSTEITNQQFPDGFTAIIETTPTVIYRYDSSLDTINIKITWKSSQYYRDK